MAEGLERRAQPVDNLRGQEAVNPVTRVVPGVNTPSAPSVPVNTYGSQIAQKVNQFASGRLAEIQQKRQERSMMDGQIAGMQGASFESVEMEGDKWALEGWRDVTAQTMSAGLLRAQENEIAQGGYEQSPDQYRATLVNRIDGMTADIPDARTRELAREQLMQQMPALVDAHMRQNIGFQEQQNFDALASSVDTLSRDNSSTGALIAFANGTSSATAGLSQERRRSAVVAGIVNSFTNNNPAAFAHLESAGFLTTDNLTSSQLQTIRAAQSAYHTRMEQQWNAEWHTDMTTLRDQVELGQVSPIVAAERYANINAVHGRRTSAAQAGQMYDAARAGVQFSEGTRGLNIQAAGVEGNFGLQSRLLMDAVANSTDSGTRGLLSEFTLEEIEDTLEAHGGNVEGALIALDQSRRPTSDSIQPVAGAVALDPADTSSWLVENQNSARRDDPISNRLVSALGAVLPAMGLRFEVHSGGQGEAGSDPNRTGSTRHDHGNAADGVLFIGDEMLDHSNPEHIPIFQEVVRRLRAQGVTGIGAGAGDGSYMGNNSIHIGYGAEAVWSSTRAGTPVVPWLREAWDAGPLGNDQSSNFVRDVSASYSDNRPDPQADRAAAELRLEQLRQRARLGALEAMGPAMAENDELFMRGERPIIEWREQRQAAYEQYGMELNSERVNQEQQMMRSVAGRRIQELQQVEDVQTAVQLETSLAAADVKLQERRAAFEAGTGDLTLDEINEEYMTSMLGAYQESGADLDASRISQDAADIVRESSDLVTRALRGQEEAAIIANAETAGTVGSLPPNLMDRAVRNFRDHLGLQVENYRAENPDAPPAEIGAIQRGAEVEYLATNNILDEALQQQINLAASGRWVDQAGNARPSTVVGLHSFVSLMSENPALAYQYVPDAQARGRMMAASHMVMSMFPDRKVFTDVDLGNRNDPVANAFYESVQQVGLSVGSEPSAEETADRISRAVTLMDRGNITNSRFGGFNTLSVSDSLVPPSLLGAGLSGVFDREDVYASRRSDRDAVDAQFGMHVERFLEEVVPHMPGTSQQGAVTMALNYVRDMGAFMGSSYIMPAPNEPSIRAQMYPGQQVESTAAVNTAIVQWLGDPDVQSDNPQLLQFQEDGWIRSGSPYTVSRVNGQYVANIIGVGSIVLPLREIGDHYTAKR